MSVGAPEHHEENAGSERWLVSYADFITLMFAFFAVLYATSEKDLAKSKEFQESIKRYLIKGGMGAVGASSSAQIQQNQNSNSVIESPMETFKETRPEAVAMLDKAETFIDSQLTKEERKRFVMDVRADEWGVRVILAAPQIYAEGSEKFREDALPFVQKLSGLLAETKRKIMIEGHVAAGERGSFRSTWDFASARAVNWLRFMQSQKKIAGDHLAALSLGDSRPEFEGERAALNSRLEVVILNQDMSM